MRPDQGFNAGLHNPSGIGPTLRRRLRRRRTNRRRRPRTRGPRKHHGAGWGNGNGWISYQLHRRHLIYIADGITSTAHTGDTVAAGHKSAPPTATHSGSDSTSAKATSPWPTASATKVQTHPRTDDPAARLGRCSWWPSTHDQLRPVHVHPRMTGASVCPARLSSCRWITCIRRPLGGFERNDAFLIAAGAAT